MAGFGVTAEAHNCTEIPCQGRSCRQRQYELCLDPDTSPQTGQAGSCSTWTFSRNRSSSRSMLSRIRMSGFGRRDCEWLGELPSPPKSKTFCTCIVLAFWPASKLRKSPFLLGVDTLPSRYNELGRQSGLVSGTVFKTVRRPWSLVCSIRTVFRHTHSPLQTPSLCIRKH